MFFWISLVVFIFVVSFAYASWRAAPWVPLRKNDIARVIALAEIKKGDKFFDLGCGDGRILSEAAIAGAEAIGFEISLLPYCLAKIRAFLLKNVKIKIRFKDFLLTNLNEADIIYFFLMPKIFLRLKEKFEKELKPGTKVISYVWPIEGWTPVKIDSAPGNLKIYLYIR